MANLDQELREVNTFFRNKGITIASNNHWLRSCMECFRSQYNNYSTRELLDFVYEQWLLADLKEVGMNSLPRECSTALKFILNGKHAVQLNYCFDVASSRYMQLQKIRRPNYDINVNVDGERGQGEQMFTNKSSNKRSVKLEIFDGQLTVIGFEDKPISCLKNPVPGEKALLKGPIECRKGVLMLTDKNIEVLGGEVDTLLIPNAASNVLARLLGQPQDPNPYKQQSESQPCGDEALVPNCFNEEDNDAFMMLAESMDTQPQQTAGSSNVNVELRDETLDFDDDDFDLVAAQTASLAEIQASSQNFQGNKTNSASVRTTVPPRSSNLSNTSVDYVDINDSKRLKRELENSYGTGNLLKQTQLDIQSNSKVKSNGGPFSSTSYLSGNKINQKIKQGHRNDEESRVKAKEGPSTSINSLQEVTPIWRSLPSKPNTLEEEYNTNMYVDAEDFDELESNMSDTQPSSENNSEPIHQPYPPRKFPALRVIRGKVVRLSEKLTLRNDQWCLSAVVAAGGLEIEMTFASEVLDKIFGVTSTELISRKNDLKNNPAAKEEMNKLLRESQLRIKNLNCEMVVRFPNVTSKPVILDVLPK